MITQLSPALGSVSTLVRAEDLFLSKGSWVHFSDKWTGEWDWAAGKLFEVSQEPLVVRYAASYILPQLDYKDVDLSNATAGLKLYPEEKNVLYQCALGFKPGDYITHIYVPKDKYIYPLGDSSMYPDVADASKKYLGAKEPSDSPADRPLIFLYFVKDGPAFYLRPYVLESVSYEQCTFVFQINKCKLQEIPKPAAQPQLAAWQEKVDRALRVAYYTELVGY